MKSVTLLAFLFANICMANVGEIINTSTCYLTITKKPIVFGKGETYGKTGELLLAVKEINYTQVRQLPVGRVLKITKKNSEAHNLYFADPSIKMATFPWGDYPENYIRNLTIEELERKTDYNLKMSCHDDSPINF